MSLYLHLACGLTALAVAMVITVVLGRQLPAFEVRGRRAGNRVRFFQGGLGAALLPLLSQATAYAVLFRVPRLRARIERGHMA